MELFRALAALAEPPSPELSCVAESLGLQSPADKALYTRLFVFQLCPYASVYLGEEGMLGGEARDRIAGFWRALGLTPPNEPDHLAVMLAFYARLAELEEELDDPAKRAGLRRARKVYLWEHLLSWLPVYLVKFAALAPSPYHEWSALLREALLAEASELGEPEVLPLHLRNAPPLTDPRDPENQTGAFLKSVLAPVRSGVILTRADLRRAAESLGLGLRASERRFILEALLIQDPAATLGWLSDEACLWATQIQRDAMFGAVATFWAMRAKATAAFLTELREVACHLGPCQHSS